jgi:putative ABC transport system permease protein
MSAGRLPGIRPRVLLHIVVAGLREHRRRSLVTILVMGLACLVVVDTSGRTDATRRSLLAALEAPSLRLVRIVDRAGQAGFSTAAVEQLRALGSVEWAIGLGQVGPIGRNAALGGPRGGFGAGAVGVRAYVGDLFGGPLVRLVSGRRPEIGEAVAGAAAARALGLADGFGAVEDDRQGQVAVVGVVEAAHGVEGLDSYALVRGGAETAVTELVVLLRASRDVEPFVARLGDLLPSREGPLGIERAAELAALTEALATDAGALDAAVLWGALGATAAMVAALRFGAIDERRREFGLRRSQGATRSTIAAIVVLESAILGAIGVVLGGAVGAVLVVAQTGLAPDPALVASVGWLLALAAVAGAIPAAVAAARRDPIEVLRTI